MQLRWLIELNKAHNLLFVRKDILENEHEASDDVNHNMDDSETKWSWLESMM